MQYRFFTLRFDEETGNFDDGEFQEFLADKNAVAVSDHFFIHEGVPYWGLLVRYLPLVPGKGERSRNFEKEAYLKEMEETDRPLFEKLREWRKEEADRIQKPLYVILDNLKLAKIAHARPKTLQDLQNLKIGDTKLEKYGAMILETIACFEGVQHGG